jgi:predicted transposase YdaD
MYLQEDILEASVVYQKIIKQGKKNEALAFVNRLLKKRFGEVQQTVQAQVEELSVEQLENLGEDLLDFRSINDLLTWLSRV